MTKSADVEFERFFKAHYDRLVRSLTAITGDAEVATDAVQEAFIKAYSRWSRVRKYDDAAMWVRRVAINKSRDAHRSGRRRRNREDRFEETPIPRTVDANMVDSQIDLAEILTQLSPRQRTVASMFYVEDISIADIAATLNISDGAVKFHLSKARARLQEVLASEARAANG